VARQNGFLSIPRTGTGRQKTEGRDIQIQKKRSLSQPYDVERIANPLRATNPGPGGTQPGNEEIHPPFFEKTWKHGLDIQVRIVTQGQLQIGLSQQQARLKKSYLNEYI
jgi:hypothetical protein